ncbi:MAG: S9 family peptidase [Bryobacteraceae bacterium]|nr:S9 family peptidase [Bryobacteraceae bacterium]
MVLWHMVLATLWAQAPTVEQSIGMKTVGAAAISPNGVWVAWTETAADWDQNAYVTHIWVAKRAGGPARQLTQGKKSANSPAWTPDSALVSFASDRDGKGQVYVIPPDGGEARAITKSETAVGDYEWSPDGKSLAYTAAEVESKAKKERKEKYGDFEIVEGDYTLSQLWVQPVNGKAEQLTKSGERTVGGFSWSPDSTRIAFAASKDPDLSHRETTDLFIVDLADKAMRALVAGPGIESNPMFSPDGREVAYQWNPGEPNSYLNGHLFAVPAGGGAARRLAARFDENPSLAAWCATGLYFTGLERTATGLFRVKGDSAERIGSGGFASFSKDCTAAAFALAKPNEPMEIWTADLANFAPRKLTDQAAQWKPYSTAVREVVRWKSEDGAEIEGVLIKPRNFDPSKKYPLLVVIHGGPTGIDTPALSPDRYYPIERFVEKGALVLRPNYRGSAGYGEKFRSLNVRNLGVGDAWDVVSGVDSLVAKGFVDRSRVGAMGWSQGGYISAFLTCASDRFKAISVGAGISDWMTYYVNTDIHPFTRTYLKATPWDDPEIYRKTSPISYIKTAKTPTLIQHGELDKRVPPPNAYELYQALKDRGVETRLVIYKGFGHGIDKPKQMLHVMEENEKWFDKYLFSER